MLNWKAGSHSFIWGTSSVKFIEKTHDVTVGKTCLLYTSDAADEERLV